jgi:hypothetical protein
MTRICTDLGLQRNWLLRALFRYAARGLPLAQLGALRRHGGELELPPPAGQQDLVHEAAERTGTGTYGNARR